MRKILFETLMRRPLTEAAPIKDDKMLAELAASLERAARRRLGRSLSIREVDAGLVQRVRARDSRAQQCFL
jgi:hypothetical protein